MKRIVTLISVLLFCGGLCSAQKVRFVPQWTPQSQFAGFYMAFEKGFYAEEGLDVTIDHVGSHSIASAQDLLIDGSADIITQQLLQSIVSSTDGRPMVNVMQITQKSGLCCVNRGPIGDISDLEGKKVGRWKSGFSELSDIAVYSKGVNIDWVPLFNGTSYFVYGAIDAALCYSYSELIALELAIGDIPEDNVLWFDSAVGGCPEDGLWVTPEYFEKNRETVEKFVRATKRGWDYARENRSETVEVVMRYVGDAHVVTNKTTQTLMLDEYLNLQVNPQTGLPDYSRASKPVYERLADKLLKCGYITYIPKYEDLVR